MSSDIIMRLHHTQQQFYEQYFDRGVVCFEARSTENVKWWIEVDKPANHGLVFLWSLNFFYFLFYFPSFFFLPPLIFIPSLNSCSYGMIGIPCAYFLYDTMCLFFSRHHYPIIIIVCYIFCIHSFTIFKAPTTEKWLLKTTATTVNSNLNLADS